jgi:hypothetical protein
MSFCPVGAELFYTGRRTDMKKELRDEFRNFVEEPKNSKQIWKYRKVLNYFKETNV